MKKVAAVTFGCKVNQYETACILDDFREAGFEVVDFKSLADVYIINSCTVTNRTDYKSRNAVRKALEFKQKYPDIKVIITGCYSQINYEKVKEIGPIDLIIDNNHKNEILNSVINENPQFSDIGAAENFSELSTTSMLDKSRAFIKVQDGCNFFCSYCAVPYGRGKPRSRDPESVIAQITKLTQAGFKEFVLGGINLGLYGREKNDNYYLHHLIRDLERLEDVEIIRLSSIEPQLFDNDLLSYIAESDKIAPHFHIPLQSGSDTILSKMKRRYNTIQFRKLIDKILNIRSDAAIGLDVIAGLPGETDKLFHETAELLHILPISYLHVFSYSIRPGTEAAEMKEQVKGDVIKERSHLLNQLSDSKKRIYLNRLISQNIPLKGVAEKEVAGYWTALSDHYIRIYSRDKDLTEKSMISGPALNQFKEGIKV